MNLKIEDLKNLNLLKNYFSSVPSVVKKSLHPLRPCLQQAG